MLSYRLSLTIWDLKTDRRCCDYPLITVFLGSQLFFSTYNEIPLKDTHMRVIHINETTQQYIADTHNEGVVPVLGKYDPNTNGEDTYYLVMDNAPNEIVTASYYYDNLEDANHEHIVIISFINSEEGENLQFAANPNVRLAN